MGPEAHVHQRPRRVGRRDAAAAATWSPGGVRFSFGSSKAAWPGVRRSHSISGNRLRSDHSLTAILAEAHSDPAGGNSGRWNGWGVMSQESHLDQHPQREFIRWRLAVFVTFTLTAACGDGETAQVTRGGNEIGPATTQAVNDRAVDIPAVRNTAATEPPAP